MPLMRVSSVLLPDPLRPNNTTPFCHPEPKAKDLSFIVTVFAYPNRCVLDRSFTPLALRRG